MKMGTTRSPSRYDGAARHALYWANLRRYAIPRYASRAAVFPMSRVIGFDSGLLNQSGIDALRQLGLMHRINDVCSRARFSDAAATTSRAFRRLLGHDTTLLASFGSSSTLKFYIWGVLLWLPA